MILTRENSASIMQFRNGKVVHETQYFADNFEPAGVVEATGSADRVTPYP